MLGLRGRTDGLAHHSIHFPADYHAEFDAVFGGRVPADPTVYVSAPVATDPGDAPPDREAWFALVNAPRRPVPTAPSWRSGRSRGSASATGSRRVRGGTPADLERETGAVGGAIYGAAPHGRLAALRRPGNAVRGVRGLWRVGGTVHPGGGLPLVALGGATVARAIGS